MAKNLSDVEKLIIMHNEGKLSKNRSGKAKSAPTTPHNEQRLAIKKYPSLEKDVMAILHQPAVSMGPSVYLCPNDTDSLSFPAHHEVHPTASKSKQMSFSNNNRNALKSVSRSTPVMANQISVESKNALPHLPKSTKKFHKHFSEVNNEEVVLNYYVCAYVADILHQGTLFITERYFAFYSNIFGYVNKILIPISEVTAIKKKKTASFIPNAIGVQTTEDKMYVFSSLISRENTYKFMDHLWRKSRKLLDSDSDPAMVVQQEMTGEESHPEDSASASGDSILEEEYEEPFESPNMATSNFKLPDLKRPLQEPVTKKVGKDKFQRRNYISKDMKLSSTSVPRGGSYSIIEVMKMPIQYMRNGFEDNTSASLLLWSSVIAVLILVLSAGYLMYRVDILTRQIDGEDHINYNTVYEEVLHMQQKLHTGTADEVEKTLGTQLKQIAMIRQSLEALAYLFNKDYANREKLEENVLEA